jgi:hypothetical protein
MQRLAVRWQSAAGERGQQNSDGNQSGNLEHWPLHPTSARKRFDPVLITKGSRARSAVAAKAGTRRPRGWKFTAPIWKIRKTGRAAPARRHPTGEGHDQYRRNRPLPLAAPISPAIRDLSCGRPITCSRKTTTTPRQRPRRYSSSCSKSWPPRAPIIALRTSRSPRATGLSTCHHAATGENLPHKPALISAGLLPPFDPFGCTRRFRSSPGTPRGETRRKPGGGPNLSRAPICRTQPSLKLAPLGCGHIRPIEIHAAGRLIGIASALGHRDPSQVTRAGEAHPRSRLSLEPAGPRFPIPRPKSPKTLCATSLPHNNGTRYNPLTSDGRLPTPQAAVTLTALV